MTYDEREESDYGGQPVECFKFVHGASTWLLTSADKSIVLPSGTYVPETISASGLDYSQEADAGALEVKLPIGHAISQLFIPYLPPHQVTLIHYRAHRGLLTDVIGSPFTVAAAAMPPGNDRDPRVRLMCVNALQILSRRIPAVSFQTLCAWDLYGVGCGVNPATFRESGAVSAVAGNTVTATFLGGHADDWWTKGWLENTTGHKRMIVAHSGTTVTLQSPLLGLVPTDTVYAQAGCDGSEATCNGKFSNIDRHLGYPRIPNRNPFTGRIT